MASDQGVAESVRACMTMHFGERPEIRVAALRPDSGTAA
jgi:hypothetical protein